MEKLARRNSARKSSVSQLDKEHFDWLQRERRTAALMRLCYIYLLKNQRLDAQEIEALCRLTWITTGDAYWLTTKLPALKVIFGLSNSVATLEEAAAKMPGDSGLLDHERDLILAKTGFVNLYNAFRGVVGAWSTANKGDVASVLTRAFGLATDSQGRQLAEEVHNLPVLIRPDGGGEMEAAKVLTPVVACLDPRRRFPVMNGRPAIKKLLRKLGVANKELTAQHDHLVSLMSRGDLGIVDSFALDVWADQGFPRRLKPSSRRTKRLSMLAVHGRDLPVKDAADIDAIRATGSVRVRRLHNKMTNALRSMCKSAKLEVREGVSPDALFDALVLNYDSKRDLLIEVKSSTDFGVIRLAVGQLLDYQRKVPRPTATDLAILLPKRPSPTMVDFLSSLNIKTVWLNKGLSEISGDWKLRKPSA